MTLLALNLGVLQRKRKLGIHTMVEVQRLLCHLLGAWLGVTVQAFRVLEFAAMGIGVFMATHTPLFLNVEAFKGRALFAPMAISTGCTLMVAR
jgi:hypothetical protein